MFRLLRFPLAAPIARHHLKTVPSAAFRRHYSSPGGASKGNNTFRLLTIAGLVGAGLGLYVLTSNGKAPTAYVEPKKLSPAFKDGEISVIFVLGGPGAGKGTQCANLVKDYGFVHLSAGDLLREERSRPGSQYGELISQYIRDGLIVPQEVTVALLENAIKAQADKGNKRFIVDGFPRKMDQAITFEEQIAKSSFTLFFECPEKVMLERLLKRGETSGRDDDNIESIKKRFRTFVETSMPVVDYFESQGKVVKVRCDAPVDKVYDDVKQALKDKL